MFMVAGSEGKLTIVAQKISVLSGKRILKCFLLLLHCPQSFKIKRIDGTKSKVVLVIICRDCQLQPSRRVRNLQPDSELCSHCDVHPLLTTRRYHCLFFLSSLPECRFTHFSELWGSYKVLKVCKMFYAIMLYCA